jgi:hypothetical protein
MNSIFYKNDKNIQKNKSYKLNKNIDSIPENSDADNLDNDITILDYNDILKEIPNNCSNCEIKELQKTHTEWRWRFFTINCVNFVEISNKQPNKNRMYMDNTGEWVNYNVNEKWKKYLVKSKYYYIN